MKYKYDIQIKTQELNELLNANKNEKIWQQKVRSKWVFVTLFNALVVSGIFIYFSRDIVNILISIGFVLPAIFLLLRARTMKYSIYPNEILFEWGFLINKKVSIPFSDITAINLVEYKNSKHSTIFFGTNKTYNIKKTNFDMNEPRPHITFENVENGKKVIDLLNLLWHRGLNSLKDNTK